MRQVFLYSPGLACGMIEVAAAHIDHAVRMTLQSSRAAFAASGNALGGEQL